MASLYLGVARRPDGCRRVALKVIHSDLARQGQFLMMLRDEARIASRVRHPNVVRVEAFRQDAGHWYLVMEYVPGRSAAQLMDALVAERRQMPVPIAVAIARAVAEGLHAAHEVCDDLGESLCLVHRDVSPGNILISEAGRVKVIDFGIAKARGRQYQTQGNRLRGKLRYLSPEQARGREIDRRTDVYALGVVLWEMLTLKRYALGQSDRSVLFRVQSPTPRPLSALRSDIPPALEAVMARALDPCVDRRFASARELADALGEAVPGGARVGPEDIAGFVEAPRAPRPLVQGRQVDAPVVLSPRRRRRPRPSPPPRPLSALHPPRSKS